MVLATAGAEEVDLLLVFDVDEFDDDEVFEDELPEEEVLATGDDDVVLATGLFAAEVDAVFCELSATCDVEPDGVVGSLMFATEVEVAETLPSALYVITAPDWSVSPLLSARFDPSELGTEPSALLIFPESPESD